MKSPFNNPFYFFQNVQLKERNASGFFSKLFSTTYSIIDLSNDDNKKFIRLVEHKPFYHFATPKYIAGIDISVNEQIKINWISVENETQHNYLHNGLFLMAEHVAKHHAKPFVFIDTHGNMKRYNDLFEQFGYETTGKKCEDNHFCVELVKKIA